MVIPIINSRGINSFNRILIQRRTREWDEGELTKMLINSSISNALWHKHTSLEFSSNGTFICYVGKNKIVSDWANTLKRIDYLKELEYVRVFQPDSASQNRLKIGKESEPYRQLELEGHV